jgi:hypothetical protein
MKSRRDTLLGLGKKFGELRQRLDDNAAKVEELEKSGRLTETYAAMSEASTAKLLDRQEEVVKSILALPATDLPTLAVKAKVILEYYDGGDTIADSISASIANDILKLCGQAWPAGLQHDHVLSQSKAVK